MKRCVKIISTAVLAVCVLMLCGCSVFNVFSVDSLIKAPRLTGDNAEIQKAFESAVGTDISLVRPVAGDYRSAYVLHDYDGDGVDEAIVFYTPKSTAGEVRMHFLKYGEADEKWVSVADVKGNGSDVHSITFCNFDRDSVAEIAVAWAFADGQKDKMLTVYHYEVNDVTGEKDFVSLASVRISDFNFIDVDFDGAEELLYTIIDAAAEKPTAVLKSLKYDVATERFVPLSEVLLDNRIVSFLGYAHDLKAGNFRFYVDSQLADGRYITEIVYFDYSHSAFVRPVDENGIPLGEKTVRQPSIRAEDINGDGFVDVPRAELYEKSEVVLPAEGEDGRVFAVEYYELEGGNKLVSIGTYYSCADLGIRIKLDKYRSSAFLRYDKSSDSIMFYSYPDEGKNNSKLLFTVSIENTETHSAVLGGSERKSAVSVLVSQTGRDIGIVGDDVANDIIFIN